MSFLSLKDSPDGSRIDLFFHSDGYVGGTTQRKPVVGKKSAASGLERLVRKFSLADVVHKPSKRSAAAAAVATNTPAQGLNPKVKGRTRTTSQSSTSSQSRRLKKSSSTSGTAPRTKKFSTISSTSSRTTTTTSPTKRKPIPPLPIPSFPTLPKLSFAPHDSTLAHHEKVPNVEFDPRLSVHFAAMEFLTLDPEPWVGVDLKDWEAGDGDGVDFGLPRIPSGELDFPKVKAQTQPKTLESPLKGFPSKGKVMPVNFDEAPSRKFATIGAASGGGGGLRLRRESLMSMRSCYSEGSYVEDERDHIAVFVPESEPEPESTEPGSSEEDSSQSFDHDQEHDHFPLATASTPHLFSSPSLSSLATSSGPHTPASSIRTDPLSFSHSYTKLPPSPALPHSTPYAPNSTLPTFRTDILPLPSSPAPPRPPRLRPVGEPLLKRRLTSSSKGSLRSLSRGGGGSIREITLVGRRPGTSDGVESGRNRPYGYF